MYKKITENVFIWVFLTVVILLGLVSWYKLARFYVRDEVDYNEWKPELGKKLETDIATTFYGKFEFVNLNGAVRNLLGQREMNGVVKMDNGYLVSPASYCHDRRIRRFAYNTSVFNDYLKEKGIQLVYAAPPCNNGKYKPEMPEGIEDYGNDNTDRLLKLLKERDVNTIDFREEMYKDNIDHYSMMYRTDHHWTTEAGFYAYGVLEKYIAEKTGCLVDERISDINNYTVTRYDKWHLGSNGQRTGIYFAGIDDFDLILPKFDTTIIGPEGDKGTMQELMINTEALSKKDYTSRYTYDSVLGASLGHYINADCKNDIKILMISDSYAKAVCPYLCMGFKEIDFFYDIDVPSLTPELIEDNKPDIVIMMYFNNVINDGSPSFDFSNFMG